MTIRAHTYICKKKITLINVKVGIDVISNFEFLCIIFETSYIVKRIVWGN